MKIKYFALSLLACVGMMSCSNNDDLAGDDGQKGDGDINAAYLAININNVGGTGTRAGGFDDGSDAENEVTSVRFYFFNSDGSACTVNQGANYKDITSAQMENETSSDNIEEISNTILVLDGITGQAPSTMVTVVNPPASLTGNQNLSALKATVADYAANCTESGKFVMSNSVYADGTTAVCETPVGAFLRSSEEDAEATPVNVYVERVVAKVKVTFSGAEQAGNMYLVEGTDGQDGAVYAKVLGWDIVGKINKSNLLKSIDPSGWASSLSGFTWNDAANHRSYWAVTPTGDGVSINNTFKFTDLDNAAGTSVYTQELTPTSAITDVVNNSAAKIVVAVQLVNKDGNAVPRYEYLGGSYASADAILAIVAPNFSQYWVSTGENTYRQLSTADLEFKSGAALNDNATYNAYPQVKSGVTLYTKSGEQYTPVSDLTSVNTALKAYNARIWTEGKCYYTTTIKHLGTSGVPQYGVVRNHVYQVNISDIAGIGTPVYDPDNDEVTPVVPSDEKSYLAATVNVLAWKVVSSDVTLGGN